jgi:hypothetical protein
MPANFLAKLLLALAGMLVFQSPGNSQSALVGSPPIAYDNASVQFLHGKGDNAPAPLALNEAISGGMAQVHLSPNKGVVVDNLSDREVFIQAGDLVIGGVQDQLAGTGLVVPPRSTGTRIEVFCVERGRSDVREGDSTSFVPGRSIVPSDIARLSIAARRTRSELTNQLSQFGVWLGVESLRARLSDRLDIAIASERSPTSLPLALENAQLDAALRPYLEALQPGDSDDILGAAFSINGRWVATDVYSSNSLFKQMWPKLLRAHAIRSIAWGSDIYKSAPGDKPEPEVSIWDLRPDGSFVHAARISQSAIQVTPIEKLVLSSITSSFAQDPKFDKVSELDLIKKLAEYIYNHDRLYFGQTIRQALAAGLFNSRPGLEQKITDAVAHDTIETPAQLQEILDFTEPGSVYFSNSNAGRRDLAEANYRQAMQMDADSKASERNVRLAMWSVVVLLAASSMAFILRGRQRPRKLTIRHLQIRSNTLFGRVGLDAANWPPIDSALDAGHNQCSEVPFAVELSNTRPLTARYRPARFIRLKRNALTGIARRAFSRCKILDKGLGRSASGFLDPGLKRVSALVLATRSA